jgi:hypothetical protein
MQILFNPEVYSVTLKHVTAAFAGTIGCIVEAKTRIAVNKRYKFFLKLVSIFSLTLLKLYLM